MIDMRYKPRHLPQVSAPYTHVVGELENEGIGYEEVEMDPEELNPMQGIVLSNEVSSFEDEEMDPIWISKDNDVMDGHHRWVKKLMAQKPIKCIKVDMNGRDGSRVLNKIQDIYEYEQSQGIEEVVLQDVINNNNDKDSGVSDNEFFAMIESDVPAPDGNKVTLEAYRKQPIKENSVVGNYFLLKPQEGYDKYEIEFDNLLDTEQMGIDCDNSQESPTDLLAKVWFPHINFTTLSETHGVAEDNMKNKAIAEKADKMGYDGIKYGNNILQGLK